MTKEEMLARVDRSWGELQAVLSGIPDERLSDAGVVGEWSIKDVLGHVAFWDQWSAEQAERRLAGEPAQGNIDVQAMNRADAAAKADWDLERIRTELDAAHAALLTAYNALPTLDADQVKEDWEHYEEHGAAIRVWRERSGI